MGRKNSVHKISTNCLVTNENINLDQQLGKSWTIESYGTHSIESSEDMSNKEGSIRYFRKDYREKW